MKIIVKNYRSFTSDKPLKLEINDGVTALVGPNNSGKSFVLKFFFEARDLFRTLANINIVTDRVKFQVNFSGVEAMKEVFSRFNSDDMEIEFILHKVSLLVKIMRLDGSAQIEKTCFNGQCVDDQRKIAGLLVDLGLSRDGNKIIDPLTKEVILDLVGFKNFFNNLERSIYFPAFRNAINAGSRESFYDIAVGEAFVSSWHDFETNRRDHSIREKAIQVENDLREIFDYKTFNIRAAPEQNEIMVNINGKSYRLSELGSGITQFILVFVNAAIKEPSFILIDEPELNLHPKLQIDFINRLLKYAGNGIIFATHSLGLAHSVAERIYSVSKNNEDLPSIIKPFDKTPKFTEFLGELNFSSFPILGFKKVLLVEGPTDLKVFSIFLHKKNKYKDFLIWPLGGSSMINASAAKDLVELKRLGKDIKVYCWIDSEKKSESSEISLSRKKFKEECKKIGFPVTISKRRSIENYFTLESIQKINPKITKLEPYDERPLEWDKGSNWRIAQEIKIDDIKDTDLYKFLDEI